MSMVELRSDRQVISVLGEPIEAGWFVTGNIKLKGIEGVANMSIPVSGPKGSGTVISRSIKKDGSWVIFLLVLRVNGDPTPIVLINKRNMQIPNAAQAT